jgi:hypothetical protein
VADAHFGPIRTYPDFTVVNDAALFNRVRKLLDKATATTNPHEAEAFSQKAASLIASHRIDPQRLADLEHDDVLEIREFVLGRGAYVRARLALLVAVAEPHDVRVVFSSTSTGMVAHAAGFRSDLDVAELMYNSLHQQAANQMSDIRRSTPAATQRFRRSFLFGYADQIGQMLGDARQKVEAEKSTSARSGSTEIVLQDRIDQVEEHLLSSFGRVRTARAASAAQSGGWNAGAAAADRADVGRTRLAGRPAIGPA